MSKKTIHCGRRLSNAKDGEQGLELPLQAVPRPVERQEGVDVAGGGGGQHAVHPAQRILPEIQRVLVAGKQPGSGVGGLCVKCYRVGGGVPHPSQTPSPRDKHTTGRCICKHLVQSNPCHWQGSRHKRVMAELRLQITRGRGGTSLQRKEEGQLGGSTLGASGARLEVLRENP